MATGVPPQRLATVADVPRLDALMKASVRAHFPHFYDERQVTAAEKFIADPDVTLIEDGTYFVHEVGDQLVGCGGWSRRDKLYSGSGDAAGTARLLDPKSEPARVRAMFVHGDWSRRGIGRAILEACENAARDEGFTQLALMATLPGVPLYEAFGFVAGAPSTITTPDGVVLGSLPMECPVRPAS